MNKIKFYIGTYCSLTIVWLLFCAQYFSSQSCFALFPDNEFLLAPFLSYFSKTLWAGSWPLWMDSIIGGYPLYNLSQISVFYPFYFCWLHIFDGHLLDVIRTMHIIILCHVFVFLINSFILMRILKLSLLASIVGSILVVFNSNTGIYLTWINIISPYAWLPLYLAGLLQLLESPSWRSAGMALTGMTLLIMASPAQPLIHAIFLSTVFCVAWLASSWRTVNFRHQVYSRMFFLGGVALLTALLTAPVLLPVLLEFKDMVRFIGPFPAIYGNQPIPFEAFLTDQLSLENAYQVLFLPLKGGAVGGVTFGVIPLALALYAIVNREQGQQWMLWAMAFIAIYSLCSAFGRNLGFAYINYHIPLLNKIREPSRFDVLFQLAGATLAAMGVNKLQCYCSFKSVLSKKHRFGILLMVAFALFSIIILLINVQNVALKNTYLICILTFIVLCILTFFRRDEGLRFKTALFLLWIAMIIGAQKICLVWNAPPFSYATYFQESLQGLDDVINQVNEFDPKHDYRVIFEGTINNQFASMLASFYGVRSFGGYVNPAPRGLFEQMYYGGHRSDDSIRLTGGRYIIAKNATPESLQGFVYIKDVSGYSIYEDTKALPRLYTLPLKSGEPIPSIRVLEHHLNRILAIVDAPKSGIFILNEFFGPNWKAKLDGEPTKPFVVHRNQIGILVSEGSHIVDLTYAPNIFRITLILAMAGVVIVILILILIKKRTTYGRSSQTTVS
jgi:hypothetical protein